MPVALLPASRELPIITSSFPECASLAARAKGQARNMATRLSGLVTSN